MLRSKFMDIALFTATAASIQVTMHLWLTQVHHGHRKCPGEMSSERLSPTLGASLQCPHYRKLGRTAQGGGHSGQVGQGPTGPRRHLRQQIST